MIQESLEGILLKEATFTLTSGGCLFFITSCGTGVQDLGSL